MIDGSIAQGSVAEQLARQTWAAPMRAQAALLGQVRGDWQLAEQRPFAPSGAQ